MKLFGVNNKFYNKLTDNIQLKIDKLLTKEQEKGEI